jgi:hypothetical protein
MNFNDQHKIKIACEYFVRADQGRRGVLDLFAEDAEIYFPKFGFGHGRESFFEMLNGFVARPGVGRQHAKNTCS